MMIKYKQKTKSDFKVYYIFLIVVLIFGFIVAKDISLPRTITLPIAGLSLMILFFGRFKKPELPFLALTAYLPFSKILIGRFGAETTGLNLTNILMIIVILSWVSHSIYKRERLFSKSTLNPIILLFCLWGLFSVLRGKFLYGRYYDFEDFFILFKRWITPVLLYFIALNMVKDKENFKKAIFVMMSVTFIVALMAIRDYISFGDSGSLEESRIGGVFEQPNMLGAFFVYNMFFFLGFFFYYWRSFKYQLLLIPLLVCFRGIMVTFSRGAYIAFGFGSLMIVFFKNKILFLFALILIIIAILNPVFLPEGIRYRMSSTFANQQVISTDIEEVTDSSVERRLLIWKGAMAMIKGQPLFGFGYGIFPYIIGYYVPQVPNADPHNTYLMIAAEMGIPGLIIFLAILFMLIKNSWWLLRHIKDRYFKAFALGMLGCLFGLIVANIFGSRLNSEEVSSYFWILSGLLMRAVIMHKRHQIV